VVEGRPLSMNPLSTRSTFQALTYLTTSCDLAHKAEKAVQQLCNKRELFNRKPLPKQGL